jgi:hypothetical protein
MKLQVYNFTGAPILDVPGVPPIAAHSGVQIFEGLTPDTFSFDKGPALAKGLYDLEAAGSIEYQFVCDAYDVGKTGTKRLRVSFDKGSFTAEDVSQAFTDDVALPVGATLINAKLIVHEVVASGDVSAAVVASGIVGTANLFDASENILAGVTERALTSGTVASDISGAKIRLTITLTDDDVVNLTAGDIELVVNYIVCPVI